MTVKSYCSSNTTSRPPNNKPCLAVLITPGNRAQSIVSHRFSRPLGRMSSLARMAETAVVPRPRWQCLGCGQPINSRWAAAPKAGTYNHPVE